MRKTLTTVAVAVLLCSFLAAASARPATPEAAGKMDAGVQATLAGLASDEMTTVVVTLADQVDPDTISGPTRAARLTRIIRALQARARTSQAGIRALLGVRENQGRVADVTPLWIVNGVSVTATAAVVRELAARPEVASITPDDVPVVPATGPAEPNQTAIGAPALWDLGETGQGVVVASLDSGVDVSHPDLASRWRGGANSWYDPYGEHPATPTDLSGHGTATMGVMVAGDASGTSIGTAPGATWIAARIFNDRGAATATAIHQAFQWVLDPDHDPITNDAPRVLNGSWSVGTGPGCNLSFQPDVAAVRAAGIVPVFAAGNFGPGTASSVSPANYPEALSVGAVSGSDLIYSASGRGPSTCGGRARAFPDLVAPGVGVLTTDRYGLYQAASGTSVSAPHVAGALALLLGARPGLSADQQLTALTSTARDLGPAGADDSYGFGRVDVLAAYDSLQGQPDTVGPATRAARVAPDAVNGTGQVPVVLTATGDDTAAGGANVVAGEYFVDTIGADGAGTPMTVAAAAPVADLTATIPAATAAALGNGVHLVSVHARDAAGNWGAVASTTLRVDTDLPSVTGPAASPNPTQGATSVALTATANDPSTAVTGAEWFVGPDPGPGNGNAMTVTGAAPWTLSATIAVAGWTEGAHPVGVRARDAVGNWSVVGSTVVDVRRPWSFSTFGSSNPVGVAGVADDADIYGWDGSAFSRTIDVSAAPYRLPSGANVDGFDRVDATHFYLSFSADTQVPGLGTVQDEDVVFFNAGTWSVFLNLTARGLTAPNQDVDAISVVGSTLYFSTVGNTNPPGVAGTADDADIYGWNGSGFARVWDATVNGLADAANVDGYVRVDATHFYLSFSPATTTVPTLAAVQDEDVVYDDAGAWSVYIDGTARGLTSDSLDVDAFDLP